MRRRALSQGLESRKTGISHRCPRNLQKERRPQEPFYDHQGRGSGQTIKKGVISGGMIPKVEACLHALKAGVRKTHIIDGTQPHALLLEIFTPEGIGTELIP